jgi:hypothetical protein
MILASLGGFAVLTNVGTAYDATDASRGLGRVTADWKAYSMLFLDISTKHIGTGTLTWQLWNETDSVEVGTVTDARDTAWHTRTATFTENIPTGIKTLRLRVRSTVATDDPAYAGATLRAA